MFLVVPLLLYFTGCQADVDSSLFSRIPDIINQLCPGSNVCSSNRSSTNETDITFRPGTGSCCAECSCSAKCRKNNNCCFPITSFSETSFEGADIQNKRYCLYPTIPEPTTYQHLYQSFFMVSSIPRTVSASQSNESCGDTNVAPWGSLYPVYSAKSNQIYKNMECAEEDGEDSDIVLWDAVIKCRGNGYADGIIMAVSGLNANSIPEGCHVSFIFPNSYDVLKPFKCYKNVIETCSESKDIQVPEGINVSIEDIRALCESSGIVSPYRADKMYANVFCHICNEDTFFPDSYCFNNDDEGFGESKDWSDGNFIALVDDKFIIENRDTSDTMKRVLPSACPNKEAGKCRAVFCPTGQMRDRRSKCVYPNKFWYNQNYAVHINLTLDKYINVSEAFNIKNGDILSTNISALKSTWLSRWEIASLFFRVMKVPYMSNNLVICMQKSLMKVKPDMMINIIKNMIGQAWSMHLADVTEGLTSANFSTHTDLGGFHDKNKFINLHNLTENIEIPMYSMAYITSWVLPRQVPITKLYVCEQVELEPSEFVLNKDEDIIYNFRTKRFMFEGQFTLIYRHFDQKYRARICLEDSGLQIKATIENAGTVSNASYSLVEYIYLIFLYESFY